MFLFGLGKVQVNMTPFGQDRESIRSRRGWKQCFRVFSGREAKYGKVQKCAKGKLKNEGNDNDR